MWELVKVGSWVTFILYLWPSVYTKIFEFWLLGRLRWRRMEASLSWLSLLGWHRKVACLGFRIFFKSRWRRCSHPVRRAKVTSSFHKSCFSFKRISVPEDFCSVPSSEPEHGAAPVCCAGSAAVARHAEWPRRIPDSILPVPCICWKQQLLKNWDSLVDNSYLP